MGLTVKEAADFLGLSEGAVSQRRQRLGIGHKEEYINGKRYVMSPNEVAQVADYLGTTKARKAVQHVDTPVPVAEDTPPPEAYRRPVTRGDCLKGGCNARRPCPWVSCRHHLALDVLSGGGLRYWPGETEVWEMAETCSLDVADRGGATLMEVGALMGVTRERIRQVQETGLEKMRSAGVEWDRPEGERYPVTWSTQPEVEEDGNHGLTRDEQQHLDARFKALIGGQVSKRIIGG